MARNPLDKQSEGLLINSTVL